jgi:CRISPR-associated endonuclease Cas3-HD
MARCKEKFEIIFPHFKQVLIKVLEVKTTNLKDTFYKMIIFHDLGKLTKRWQERVGTKNRLPAHAPIGAGYLWKVLPQELKVPLCFAVAIHHSDRGLLGDNIERPDALAINDGVADLSGRIVFDGRAGELDEYYPEEIILTVEDLRDMARGLRRWAKGCSIPKQHKRRLQASLSHHILKLCDVSSAKEREEFKRDKEGYWGGWLMVEKIDRYVRGVEARRREDISTLSRQLRRH